jgi:hypothetical protein
MRSAIFRVIFAASLLGWLSLPGLAQQTGSPVQDSAATRGNAGQASQPGGVTPGVGSTIPSTPAAPPATTPQTTTLSNSADTSDNPYDPLLEPPPLPKGKPTLIGGIATHVDHVRDRLTIQPFGKGAKVKIFIDERSHIYRNGTETTVLGIHQGDRVYADTMLDGSKVFAKNVRVITQPTLAEVRGQVIAVHPEKGTVIVQDQLSSKPVSFAVGGLTKYSSPNGNVTAADVRPGSLVDVQFATGRQSRDIATDVTIVAKPGDSYLFAGEVTSIDMHNSMFVVENRSDDQAYEVHFDRGAMPDARELKVGEQISARAIFDGKQYKTNDLTIEKSKPEDNGEQSQVD